MVTKNIMSNKDNTNFIITNTILNIKNWFNIEQVTETLKEYSIDNKRLVKQSIERLRDNDYLEEDGSYYRVLNNRESRRWN